MLVSAGLPITDQRKNGNNKRKDGKSIFGVNLKSIFEVSFPNRRLWGTYLSPKISKLFKTAILILRRGIFALILVKMIRW